MNIQNTEYCDFELCFNRRLPHCSVELSKGLYTRQFIP